MPSLLRRSISYQIHIHFYFHFQDYLSFLSFISTSNYQKLFQLFKFCLPNLPSTILIYIIRGPFVLLSDIDHTKRPLLNWIHNSAILHLHAKEIDKSLKIHFFMFYKQRFCKGLEKLTLFETGGGGKFAPDATNLSAISVPNVLGSPKFMTLFHSMSDLS